MKTLYIKHIDIEGPETLGQFFDEKGFESQTIEMDIDDNLPNDPSEFDAIIGLGGPMNVYEEDKHPFLAKENIFLQKMLEENVPYLGLCLGSQLLAKAADAKVTRSPQEEIGWYNVELNAAGKSDSLFSGIDPIFDVYHWHGDMFNIPESGTLLASSPACPHQAFRIGNAYGLQFHVEITEKSIREWSQAYAPDNVEQKNEMLNIYKQKQESFDRIAYKMYENFYQIIKGNK